MELQFHPDPARKLSTNLYDIYHYWVYSEWTPDDGQRHCPKHVEFHAQNKFAKLVHLVGLIIKKSTTGLTHRTITSAVSEPESQTNKHEGYCILGCDALHFGL